MADEKSRKNLTIARITSFSIVFLMCFSAFVIFIPDTEATDYINPTAKFSVIAPRTTGYSWRAHFGSGATNTIPHYPYEINTWGSDTDYAIATKYDSGNTANWPIYPNQTLPGENDTIGVVYAIVMQQYGENHLNEGQLSVMYNTNYSKAPYAGGYASYLNDSQWYCQEYPNVWWPWRNLWADWYWNGGVTYPYSPVAGNTVLLPWTNSSTFEYYKAGMPDNGLANLIGNNPDSPFYGANNTPDWPGDPGYPGAFGYGDAWNITGLAPWNVSMLQSPYLWVMYTQINNGTYSDNCPGYIGLAYTYFSANPDYQGGYGGLTGSENFGPNANALIWLIVVFLPALILGEAVPKIGYVSGIVLMLIILGFSQSNFLPVTFLGITSIAVMEYKDSKHGEVMGRA